MPPEPTPTPPRRAVSPLDHRLEAATGHDIDSLGAYRDRGVLDEAHAHLVYQHREVAEAQRGVVLHLRLLHRLSSGDFDVNESLFARIERTADQLEQASAARDATARNVLVALEPIEAAAAASWPGAK
ncbi:hypothetical protein AB0D00_32740 [Streptomyces sp. NPDC048213]|uniref:hypothetical protein n=1 Tax=Streptomyces sp. NPDC048213 TaxID=3160984 RepID=UPI0033E22A64